MAAGLDRRAFLGACAGAGIPAILADSAWAAVAAGGPVADPVALAEITKEQVAAAEKVLGLSFDDADREQMLTHLEEALDAYQELHRAQIPNFIQPAFQFEPAPPGVTVAEPPSGEVRVRPAVASALGSAVDLGFASITELGALLRSGAITVRALVERTLARIEECDPALHAVVTVTRDRALRQAEVLDAEALRGEWRGPLHGIPWGAKDLLAVPEYPTTWGSELYKARVIPVTAQVVARLDDAGAVLVAKLALGELAYGDQWFGGRTRNPWRLSQGSTGSSSGSAAAVAAGLVPFSIGSETLGSILAPATRCGVSGLRPTYGRVSRFGAMSLAWTLDKLGPLARTVEDLALVFDAIHGEDSRDHSARSLGFAFDHEASLDGIRVGLHPDLDTGDSEERRLIAVAVASLRALGARMQPLEWPDQIPAVAMDIIMRVECAAAFEELTANDRDDGLLDQSVDARPNVFRAAHFIPAVQYVQANRVRSMATRRLDRLFREVDVFLVPPMTEAALVTTNLTGHPAVTIPVGGPADGAQHGLTVIGALWREDLALRVAHAWQVASQVHRRRPPAFS